MEPLLVRSAPLLQKAFLGVGKLAIWLGILPFFLLCWYAHPSADDFLQATDVSKHGHFGYLQYMYLNWAGRYTAMLGCSLLNPVSYGNIKAGYGLVCLLLLILLLVSLALMLRAMVRGAGFTVGQLWLAGAAALLLFTYHLPNTAEYFYWLTSSFTYLTPAIFLLLALATLAAATQKQPTDRSFHFGIVAVLVFLTVGCNETITVPLFLTVWGIVAVESWRQRRLMGLSVGLAVTAGVALAVLAPGNFARAAAQHSVSPGILLSVIGAFKFTAYLFIIWLGNGILVVVTLLLIPLFARLARMPTLPINQLTRHPLLLTLLLPAFMAAGIFPSVWATGAMPPPRAIDLLYLCFLVNWMLAAHAWVRYFVQQPGFSTLTWHLPSFVRWTFLAWLPLTFLNDFNHRLLPGYRLSTNNSFLAYRDLFSGGAARYDAELVARYQYLLSSPHARPQVQALTNPPITLLFGDITADSADWSNMAYAEFFKKKTIIAQPDKVNQ